MIENHFAKIGDMAMDIERKIAEAIKKCDFQPPVKEGDGSTYTIYRDAKGNILSGFKADAERGRGWGDYEQA